MSNLNQAQDVMEEHKKEVLLAAYRKRRKYEVLGLPVFAALFGVLTYIGFILGHPFKATLVAGVSVYILIRFLAIQRLAPTEYMEKVRRSSPTWKDRMWLPLMIILLVATSFFDSWQ